MSEKNKIFKKLPSVFQTEIERQFFDSTFEQLFSSKDSEKEFGYIGRRVSGFYDAINDYFLSQQTKNRTWYQLEPISVSTDETTLENSNEVFYDEILNRLSYLQGNIDNQDRLFKGKYYSFAPPIEYDKFINFQAYLWISDLPAIDLPNATDLIIQTQILNASSYSYALPNTQELVFTNGLKVSFSNSALYTREYIVEGVGDQIILVEDNPINSIPTLTDINIENDIIGKTSYTYTDSSETVVFENNSRVRFTDSYSYNKVLIVSGVGVSIQLTEDPFATSNPDYLTIQRGSLDGNQWSRSNKWFHKNVITTMSAILNVETLLQNSTQARRPIVEFLRDVELYDYGIRFRGDVNVASVTPFADLENATLPVSVDGVPLLAGEKLIFLTDTTNYTFPNINTFNPVAPPYNYSLITPFGKTPFTDRDDIYVIVKRPVSTYPGGYKYFYNPTWYSVSDELNTLNFSVRTTGANGVYNTLPTDSIDNTLVSDDIPGLLDTQYTAGNNDIADVYINANVAAVPPVSDVSRRIFTFNNTSLHLTSDNIISFNIENFSPVDSATGIVNNTSPNYSPDYPDGATPAVIHSGKSYDYNYATPDSNTIIDSIVINASTITVTSNFAIPTNSKLTMYIKQPVPITLTIEDYIWQATQDSDKLYLLPYQSIHDSAVLGDTVFVTEGNTYKNNNFYFNGSKWIESQNVKTTINQAPLFNLYYTKLQSGNPRSLSNFNQSTFRGSKIFNYKIGSESGIDPVLGFPLEYKSLGEIADIVFEHYLITDTYNYNNGSSFVKIPGYYYYKRSIVDRIANTTTPDFDHTWKPVETLSQQRIVDRLVVVDAASPQILTLSVMPNAINIGTDSMPILGSDTKVVINGVKKAEGTDYVISGMEMTFTATLNVDDVVEARTYSDESLPLDAEGYYEIPKQLENNPNNMEVLDYSENDLTNHFASIMSNQPGFVGDPLSSKNNYRDTKQDISLGEYILETENPLLKAMFISSADNVDVISAIEFSSNEYVRFKDKFIKNAGQLATEYFNPGLQINTLKTDQAFNEVINRINNTAEYFDAFSLSYMISSGTSFKEESFVSANVTVGGQITLTNYIDLTNFKNSLLMFYVENGKDVLLKIDEDYSVSYTSSVITINVNNFVYPFTGKYVVRLYENPAPADVPSTPSKIGCYDVYSPKIELDTSYITPTYMMLGHDGSRTPMFTPKNIMDMVVANTAGPENIDLRDTLLLDFEIRIYNNIVPKFRNDYNILFGWADIIPGMYRDTGYTFDEKNDIFRASFLKWVARINANYSTNSTADISDWRTWNYKLANPNLPGNWKGLYRYHYDTITPGTTPWEMLGFSEMPSWWVTEYGTNYGSTNTALWNDLETGTIRGGSREGVDERFARTNLSIYIPVDSSGNNKEPSTISIANAPSAEEIIADWVFGDCSPVEEAWMNSSEYRFVLMEKMYIMKPSQFGEKCWDPYDLELAEINKEQIITSSTFTRTPNSSLIVHGETQNGQKIVKHGYQRFISDRLLFLGQNPTIDFGNFIRNLDVKLGHRYGGFTNIDTMKFYFEGTSTSSQNVGLIVPSENIAVKIHKGLPLKEYVYSGVVIRITDDNKYEVYGYDVLTPYFKVFNRAANSPTTALSVGGTNSNFRVFNTNQSYNDGEIVQYNTQFYQSLAVQTPTTFKDGTWKKLAALPTMNGVNLIYRSLGESDVSIVEYGTKFSSEQEVYDFLISYGDYLKSEGWDFSQVDTDTNVVKDWKNAGKDFAFWTTTSWAPNNSIFISPISDKVTLTVSEGYPDNIEKSSNGVYSILDESGYAVMPTDVVILRDDQTISVSHKSPEVGIYCLRITTKETESIFVFDNNTVFNDVVYDPILMDRQKRLKVDGLRSRNWFGKLEANGYMISGNKLIPNFENLTDSIRNYYNSEVELDNPQMEDTARHLIGYQNRSYLENLQLLGDTQYLFYKGMIPEKGSVQPVNKLLRSTYVKGNENTEIYEEWAFRVGEYGSVNDHSFVEFGISGTEIKADPQRVQLSFPAGPAHTKSVISAIITNATEVHTDIPYAIITPAAGDTFTVQATASLILTHGVITSIDITNGGSGYNATPSITIYRADSSVSTDTAILLARNEVTYDDPSDQTILIDIDDNDRWLTRPREQSYLNLLPLINLVDIDTTVKNAGYVHFDDIDFTAYDETQIVNLWNSTNKVIPGLDSYIWVANANIINKEWTVLKLFSGVLSSNELPGYIVADESSYTYVPSNAATVSDVTQIFDNTGKDVTTTIDLATTTNLIFKNVRYPTLSTAIASGESTAWVDNNGTGWAVYSNSNFSAPIRTQSTLVNSGLFTNMLVYSRDTGKTIMEVPVYDPFKGFIPGIADRNITYKNDYDPSKYTIASDPMLVNDSLSFDSRQEGLLWWDLSKAKYVYYEQDTAEYRTENWGSLFPGSEVLIYEWVSSDVPPAQYAGSGTPKNTTDYVVRSAYDAFYDAAKTVYYFWVKDKNTIPQFLNHRSMSGQNVARLINNPRTNGYIWFSFIDEYNFIFNNLNPFIQNTDSVIQINYSFTDNENPKHVEWKLISKDKASSLIPDRFWNKMVDSLVGFDTLGNIVPDPKLSVFEKYGNKIRPRQSWFVNISDARKILVQNANAALINIKLKDINSAWNALLPSNNFWQYVDWFETGYTVANTVPLIEVTSLADLSPEDKTYLGNGGIVKVFVENNSTYYTYSLSNNAFTIVRREKTAMQLDETIYTTTNSMALNLELRGILNAVSSYIFINDYIVYKNSLFFALVIYALSEQKDVDWVFKTTYLNISQIGEQLLQDKNYQPDSLGEFINYINEVKPYQTKIRDYDVSYATPIDYANGTAYDMDSLTYTTDSDGNTIYNTTFPFDPNSIPRNYSVIVVNDSVQPGFIDKEIFIPLGSESKSADGTSTSYIFTSVTSVWKIYVNGRLLDRSEYITDEDITTNNLIVTFNSPPTYGMQNIVVISAAKFTHTAIEEMRLSYNVPNNDVKTVNFDLDLTHAGTLKTGWDGSPWDTYGWGVSGVSLLTDPAKIKQFTIFSGTSSRYLKTNPQYTDALLSFAASNGIANYSQYTIANGINATTVSELADLALFNQDYADTYKTNFEGKIINAESFEYLSGVGWDSEGWSSAGWDRRIVTPRITTSVGPETILAFTFVADGNTSTFRFNDVVVVDSATIDGTTISTTVTPEIGYTYVTTSVVPALGETLVINLHYTTEHNFETQQDNDVLDASVFVPTPSDVGVPDELAIYKTSENVVITVDTNGKSITEVFAGNSSDNVFPLVQNLSQGVSIDSVVTTESHTYTLTIDVFGNYSITLDSALSTGETLTVNYRIGALRQYYGADDARHWDGNTTNQVVYVNGFPQPVVDDEAGWDGEEWDNYTGKDYNDLNNVYPYYSGTATEHTSRYLLPTTNTDVRVYVVDDSTTGVQAFTFQKPGVDYNIESTLSFIAVSTDPVYERTVLKNQYRSYIQQFYPLTPMVNEDTFVGDGSEVTFTTSKLITQDSVLIFTVDGQVKTYTYGTEYTIVASVNGTSNIVLSSPLALNSVLVVDYETIEFTEIFNTSNIVAFISQHHMQVIDSDPTMSQKVLIEYQLGQVSFKIHLTEQDTKTATRVSNQDSTYLSKEVKESDQEIYVNDVSVLPVPTLATPGVIWIGGERLTYVAIDVTNNILKGVLRHTDGTSIAATRNPNRSTNSTYPVGKKVTSGNNEQFVPSSEYFPWENSIGGLAMSTSVQAEFLRARPGNGVGV